MTIDSEKWLDASEYLKQISEYTEQMDIAEGVSAEDIQGMNSGMYYHSSCSGANLSIAVSGAGDTAGMTLNDFSDDINEKYESMGFYCRSKFVTLNGSEWLRIDVDMPVNGSELKIRQYYIFRDGKEYIFTYTAEKSAFRSGESDFEEVMNSFDITD